MFQAHGSKTMKCYTCWKLWWCQNCFFVQARGLPIRPLTSWYDLYNPSGPSACTKVSNDLQSRHSQNWKSWKARSSSEKMDSLQPSLCNRFATAISIFQLPSVPRCSVHVSRPSQQNPSDPVPRHASLPTPESTENGRWMRIVKENMSNMSRLTSTETDFTTWLYHDVLGSIAFAANARLMTKQEMYCKYLQIIKSSRCLAEMLGRITNNAIAGDDVPNNQFETSEERPWHLDNLAALLQLKAEKQRTRGSDNILMSLTQWH